jgi:hypothetical protein
MNFIRIIDVDFSEHASPLMQQVLVELKFVAHMSR